MREIRFRGRRKDNGEWVYGWLIGDTQTFIISSFMITYRNTGEKTIDPSCSSIFEVIHETVGQYTGHVDKNLKEIYEKDLVKTMKARQRNGKIYPMELEEEVFIVEWQDKISIGWNLMKLSNNNYEVIGNIYDKPELLEK